MSATWITPSNAADYPPPSLNAYRTDASRAAADCAPVVWFKQMTGKEWDRQGRSYDCERKRYSRMMADSTSRAKETERLQKRDAERQAQQKRDAEERAEQRREAAPFNRRDDLFLFLLQAAGIVVNACGLTMAAAGRGREVEQLILRDTGITVDGGDARDFVDEWDLRYLESADFLGFLYGRIRDGVNESCCEFVYRLAHACRKYHEFVADIVKSGAAFRLPTEGPAAAISRLGLLKVTYECGDCCGEGASEAVFSWSWDGDDSRLNGDAETQVRPAPHAPPHRPSRDAPPFT